MIYLLCMSPDQFKKHFPISLPYLSIVRLEGCCDARSRRSLRPTTDESRMGLMSISIDSNVMSSERIKSDVSRHAGTPKTSTAATCHTITRHSQSDTSARLTTRCDAHTRHGSCRLAECCASCLRSARWQSAASPHDLLEPSCYRRAPCALAFGFERLPSHRLVLNTPRGCNYRTAILVQPLRRRTVSVPMFDYLHAERARYFCRQRAASSSA